MAEKKCANCEEVESIYTKSFTKFNSSREKEGYDLCVECQNEIGAPYPPASQEALSAINEWVKRKEQTESEADNL